MQEERDILSRRVFPRLRQTFEGQIRDLREIDLRWGVTTTTAKDGGAVRICLEGVQAAAPCVMGLVGERIGWVPPSEFVGRADPQLQKRLPHGIGLTGIEICYAAFLAERSGVRFPVFLRTSRLTEELGASPDQPTAMAVFKDWLAGCAQIRLHEYDDFETFAAIAERELRVLLHTAADAPTMSRLRPVELDRKTAAAALTAAVRRRRPVILTGPEGAGLSALARTWAEATPCSNVFDGRRQAMEEIEERLREWFPSSLDRSALGVVGRALAALFRWLIPRTSRRHRIVIDHFEHGYRTSSHADLAVLPERTPRGCELVVVIRHPRLLAEAQDASWPVVHLDPPAPEESLRFCDAYLAGFGKTLEDEQLSMLAAAPWVTNLHLLRLVLDELRRYGRMEDLSERLEALCALRDGWQVIDEIKTGVASVLPAPWQDALEPSLIAFAISLRGISETDCRDVAARAAGVPEDALMPAHLWSAVRLAFGAALHDRSGRVDLGNGAMLAFVQHVATVRPEMHRLALAALGEWLQRAPPAQRAEEAPRLALALGGAPALAELLSRPEIVQEITAVGESFLEGWVEDLTPDDRQLVATAWADAGRAGQLTPASCLALGNVAVRSGATEPAEVLLGAAAGDPDVGRAAKAVLAHLTKDPAYLRRLVTDACRLRGTLDAPMTAEALVALTALADGSVVADAATERRAMAAIRRAAPDADPDILEQIRHLTGQILIGRGRWRAADRAFASAERLARRTGNGRALCDALERRSAVSLELNRFRLARRKADECRTIAQRRGLHELEALALERLIEVARRRARWEEAFNLAAHYFDRAEHGVGTPTRAQKAFEEIERAGSG